MKNTIRHPASNPLIARPYFFRYFPPGKPLPAQGIGRGFRPINNDNLFSSNPIRTAHFYCQLHTVFVPSAHFGNLWDAVIIV